MIENAYWLRKTVILVINASSQIQCAFKWCVPKINHQFAMKIAKLLTKFIFTHTHTLRIFIFEFPSPQHIIRHCFFSFSLIRSLLFGLVDFSFDADYSYALKLRTPHKHISHEHYFNFNWRKRLSFKSICCYCRHHRCRRRRHRHL